MFFFLNLSKSQWLLLSFADYPKNYIDREYVQYLYFLFFFWVEQLFNHPSQDFWLNTHSYFVYHPSISTFEHNSCTANSVCRWRRAQKFISICWDTLSVSTWIGIRWNLHPNGLYLVYCNIPLHFLDSDQVVFFLIWY